jgi:tRNA threonylcarbamoyladenosine modification (KEOPS) complex Cgi121 subunit
MEVRQVRSLIRCYKFGGGAEAETLRRTLRSSFPRILVQVVDSAVVSNERVVEMIGEQTLKASESGSSLAKKAEVDLLLRLAGTTQISEAIEKIGAKPDRPFLVIVAAEEKDLARLETGEGARWERLPSRPLTTGDLTRIEKAALLDVERA